MVHSNESVFRQFFNKMEVEISDEKVRRRTKAKREIAKWDEDQDKNQAKLLRQIREGRYKISPYHVVNVMLEKPRTLAILPYRDKIFQDLMLNSMKFYFDKVFIRHTYACIKDRGTSNCIKYLQKILKEDIENTKYYIQYDLKKYFPSVNNEILKKTVRKTVKDKKLLELHDQLIDSYEGLPIGNSTSQYYANLMISYVLHKLLSKFNKYKIHVIVYMDDIIILCSNKKYLQEITDFLNEELDKIDLKLKNPNPQVYVVRKNGIRFLGYQLYGDYTLIRRNVIDKCWKLVNKFCDGKISKEEFKRRYSSYNGMFKLADTRGLCFKLYNYIYEKTGEKLYFNNWNGELVKLKDFKNKCVRVIDITSFNKKYRIDFVYQGKSYRILSESRKLVNDILKNKLPCNFRFK